MTRYIVEKIESTVGGSVNGSGRRGTIKVFIVRNTKAPSSFGRRFTNRQMAEQWMQEAETRDENQ